MGTTSTLWWDHVHTYTDTAGTQKHAERKRPNWKWYTIWGSRKATVLRTDRQYGSVYRFATAARTKHRIPCSVNRSALSCSSGSWTSKTKVLAVLVAEAMRRRVSSRLLSLVCRWSSSSCVLTSSSLYLCPSPWLSFPFSRGYQPYWIRSTLYSLMTSS